MKRACNWSVRFRALLAFVSLRLVLLAVFTATALSSANVAALSPGSDTRGLKGTRSIVLATTTSVRDSGLLDAIIPRFTDETGIEVRTIAVGTGAALRMGEEGNADVLITHAPSGEERLVRAGVALERRPFMENFFVIAGPDEDPADVRGAKTAGEAFARIRDKNAKFVSRADDSGTHRREKALLREAGLDESADWSNVSRTGAGMGLTLQVAGERGGYVLTDRGTFLAFRERVGLVGLSKPSDALRNVYAILPIDPARFEGRIRGDAAAALVAYVLSAPVQRLIGEFGVERFGETLFTPLHREGTGD